MVIEGITGGTPHEVRRTEQAERRKTERRDSEVDKGGAQTKTGATDAESVTTDVSDRSRAAIKAYRLASESKPAIARAQKVAMIKFQIEQGTYGVSSGDISKTVVDSIVKDV